MRISTKDWKNYIDKLSKLNKEAGDKMSEYVAKKGFDDPQVIDYAYGLVTKYGEGSASLSAMMYDAIAEMEGKILPSAEVAETPEYGEVAKAINGVRKHSQNPNSYGNVVNRLVKRTGADTMLKNADRDGAEFAWVPSGDTCAFCIALASRGWQHISKKSLKNGHAEHIHANCDCNYTVRFDGRSTVEGYDPDEYLEIYNNAEGSTPDEKINSIRAKHRAENRDKINAQKRANYAALNSQNSENKNFNNNSKNGIIIVEYDTKDAKGYAHDNFDRKISLTTMDDDIKATNPNYNKGEEYKSNCQRCCPTFLLRRQGFDVIANPDGFGSDKNIEYLLHRAHHLKYVKSDGTNPTVHFTRRKSMTGGKLEIEAFMKDLPDGAICEISCEWTKKAGGGGHVFLAIKENGVVRYKDPQNGEENASYYFKDMTDNTDFIRIDDTKVNEDYIWYIARNKR